MSVHIQQYRNHLTTKYTVNHLSYKKTKKTSVGNIMVCEECLHAPTEFEKAEYHQHYPFILLMLMLMLMLNIKVKYGSTK